MSALMVIASQLGSLIENVKEILSLERKASLRQSVEPKFDARFVRGKSGARGYAFGEVVVLSRIRGLEYYESLVRDKSRSMADFTRALADTQSQLETLQNQVKDNLADAASMIFTAHLLMLKDRDFIASMEHAIRSGADAVEAVIDAGKKYISLFLNNPNDYIKEKAKDIEDLVTRVLANIINEDSIAPGLKEKIAIAKDLFPSDVLKLYSEGVRGIVLTSGGVTSHVSILARSLSLPLVIANEPGLLNIESSSSLLLDAEAGNVFINPDKLVLAEYKDNLWRKGGTSRPKMGEATSTADGRRIRLLANVNLIKDVEALRGLSCDGIGLYRSEIPFIVRNSFPSEEEQYYVYRKIADGAPKNEITIRTLDIGGDKLLTYFHSDKRENPFLGMRSIRFSLANPEIFEEQLRAILRAGAGKNLKIMFPMIFSVEEFLRAKEIVQNCIRALKGLAREFNDSPRIGLMIEVPAAIEIIDELASVADFLSIGTNDLVQYMLAVDRTNEEVADYYIPHHPAVLRSIKKVADAAARHSKEISVCGDMTNEKKYIPFLIGCGIFTLSMNAMHMADNQGVIASISAADSESLANEVLVSTDINEIDALLTGFIRRADVKLKKK
jgi:phosphotransferase system enzyme I (PtsP)